MFSFSVSRCALSPVGRRVGVLAVGAALTAAASLAPVGAAHSAEPNDCPEAYPAADLHAGDGVTGLTVSSGTTPEEISGTFVGTIEDGIAPGVPMLIFRMSGSLITTADGEVDRGIWAGMSGSPVYADDGRLVGAISYGLSLAPSDYAGVTPAADMYDLRTYTKAPATQVPVPMALATKLRSAGATAQETSQGMQRLRMPLNITAAGPISRVQRIAEHTGHRALTLRRAGGSAGSQAQDIPIVPGGNLANSIAYGEVTAASIGTATAVCGQEVFGFGHPDSLAGRTSTTMHGADAVYIEKDLLGSFKVANLGSPQGRISQDRIAGVLGRLGTAPRTTRVSVSTTAPYKRHSGTSYNSQDDYLSLVAGTQVMNGGYVADDRVGQGRAQMTWTLQLQRRNGETFAYTRRNVYSNRWDIAGAMPFEVASDIDTLLGNRFAHLRVNSVKVRSGITDRYEAYRVTQLDYRSHGHWRTATNRSVVTVGAGQRLRVRVTLTPKDHSAGTVHRFTQTVVVPERGTRGRIGTLQVRGQAVPFWQHGTGMRGATSLTGLLERMHAPHNDTVSVALVVGRGESAPHRQYQHTAPSVVSGSRGLTVLVTR